MLSTAMHLKGRTAGFTFLRLMMNGQRRTSPAVEGRRKMALSDSGVVYQYGVRRAKYARRKRLEVRRLKYSNLTKPCFPGDNECFKKTKCENGDLDFDVAKSEDYSEERAHELSLSYSSSSDCFSENDVFSSRISSFKGEALERGGKLRSVPCSLNGSISVIGRRREMEDAVTVELRFLNRDSTEYDFFGVYDGHGGSSVAHACRDRLHYLLAKEIEEGGTAAATTSVDWEKVMVACFGKMDEEVYETAMKEAESTALSETIGSTAVVAVVGEEVVVVANCGDSRAVLSRGGVAVSMSNDHKPDRPDELERIEGAGGKVINWDGHRVFGVLATSRSIGDHYLKPFVIPKPEVIVSKRTGGDEFLILATDGLWDVVSNEVACQVVRRCLDGRMKRRFQLIVNQSRSSEVVYESRAAEAAAVLAELAMARGSKDNISVVVVDLNKIGECTG